MRNDPYIKLIDDILNWGTWSNNRTGVRAISLYGQQIEYFCRNYAPVLTLKKIPLKSTIGELLWFLEGSTDVEHLKQTYKCSFWDEWQGSDKTIGPMYGAQWRGKSDSQPIDQISNLIDMMVNNPNSRRLIVDSWTPSVLPDIHDKHSPSESVDNGLMSLAPCHFAFQVNCTPDENENVIYVDLMWYQRSADVFLGLPVNIASYHLLLELLCYMATETTNGLVKYKSNRLICSLGNCHIYSNHMEPITNMLKRAAMPYPYPKFDMTGFNYSKEDLLATDNPKLKREIQLALYDCYKDYQYHDEIKGARNV